jgi:hypothetical protein
VRPSFSESERYEVCEVASGDAADGARVLATAATLAAARLALRTLGEEGEAACECLVIREAATGRRLPARRR